MNGLTFLGLTLAVGAVVVFSPAVGRWADRLIKRLDEATERMHNG